MDDFKQLSDKLKALGGNPVKALGKGMDKVVGMLQRSAKNHCPAPTGQLRGSIETFRRDSSDEVFGKVYTNNDHAAFVEYGTGQRGIYSPSPPKSPEDISHRVDWAGMEAKPYMYPALTENMDNIRDTLANALKTAIKEAMS